MIAPTIMKTTFTAVAELVAQATRYMVNRQGQRNHIDVFL